MIKRLNIKRKDIAAVFIISLVVLILAIKSYGNKDNIDDFKMDDNSKYINDSNYSSFEDNVTLYGITEIRLNENCKKAELKYENPEQNKDKYYISISIELKESHELLYSSDLIPAGMGLDTIELSRSFSRGNYDAVMHVQAYKTNDLSSSKNADFEIKIIVE